MWLTSLKNLTKLARNDGFNEYFQKVFVGIEASYLRWKEVFDVLEIGSTSEVGPDLPLEQQVLMITESEDMAKLRALAKLCSPDLPLEQQVLMITESEDMAKLRALAKLCSKEFFDDPSLLVAVSRRILEVLVLAMPPVVKKGEKEDDEGTRIDFRSNPLKKVETLRALGDVQGVHGGVGDFEGALPSLQETDIGI
ncbi:hypothetical protein TL16_g10152 [Triparma laevis f. inornata]|uniref:Uncharacterized protein n=1 Tax=Triparma laevis f. inornata TaxID=1714386 RepID=A0A9W7EPF7_9STRA|nr:hypothetical protein TL16_g10152 [Triparma laevis f. inornata]